MIERRGSAEGPNLRSRRARRLRVSTRAARRITGRFYFVAGPWSGGPHSETGPGAVPAAARSTGSAAAVAYAFRLLWGRPPRARATGAGRPGLRRGRARGGGPPGCVGVGRPRHG